MEYALPDANSAVSHNCATNVANRLYRVNDLQTGNNLRIQVNVHEEMDMPTLHAHPPLCGSHAV